MSEKQMADVADRLDHMCLHMTNAINLSKKLAGRELNEDDHLFWALVKYAENVQECIVKLDEVNKTILPALDEIPLDPQPEAGFSWNGMKGMRQKLVHDFRNIDPKILWQTVTSDFPVLLSLLSHVVIAETREMEEGSGRASVAFKVRDYRGLPAVEVGTGFMPGNRMIALFFDQAAKARCVRFGRVDDRTITFDPSPGLELTDIKFSLRDGGDVVEDLGEWLAPNP